MRNALGSTGFRRAFSLVELLVVIGILAILVGMLLPALSAVQSRAREVQCQASLREIGLAATLHSVSHGYYPLAGWHWDPEGGVVNPKGLGDPEARNYTYYTEGRERRPAPVTAALAASLGIPVRLDGREALTASLQTDAVRRHFTCPSQEPLLTGISQISSEGWSSPPEWSSYVFNESVLGRPKKDRVGLAPLGKVSKVRSPATVMLAMDGRPREQDYDNFLLVPDQGMDCTLLDFHRHVLDPDSGKGRQTFDYLRHRWRMNVLFVDGHVESVPMSESGFSQVGVSRGVY